MKFFGEEEYPLLHCIIWQLEEVARMNFLGVRSKEFYKY
jgi:hypothetical protein